MLILHGTTVSAVWAKIYGVLYNQSCSIAFDETSSYWLAPKSSNFLAFHWSPQGSLVSIGQNVVTTRVVHLPKRTETSLITESDHRASDHQLCSYAWPAQPGSIWTRLCGSCIAAIAGFHILNYYYKGNIFCDFLFASLDKIALPKWGQPFHHGVYSKRKESALHRKANSSFF